MRAEWAAEEEEEKAYAGRGCAGVLEVLCRGGSQYGLAPIIFVTAGTEVWSRH